MKFDVMKEQYFNPVPIILYNSGKLCSLGSLLSSQLAFSSSACLGVLYACLSKGICFLLFQKSNSNTASSSWLPSYHCTAFLGQSRLSLRGS